MTERRKGKEVGFAAFMTLLSAALLAGALALPPQSAQFPRFLMGLQLLLSLGLLVRAWRAPAGGDTDTDDGSGAGAAARGRPGVPLQVFAATALYVIAIEQLGYFVASALFLCGTMFVFGRHRLRLMLGVAAGFLLAMYLLFVQLMGVRLPEGLLI